MKLTYTIVVALLITGVQLRADAPPPASSADDALVDGLVQEGLLSHAQADRIRAKVDQAEAETPSSKIALSDSVQKLTFYGDGRLRFENIDQVNHYEAPVLYDRERYRLRIGADYAYSDNLKAGFELESGTTDDSANQTFGSTFTKASINVGKIYLRYDPTDWLTAYAGKFTNPWYTTTDMVYSQDLNPEGGAEIFTFHPTDNLTVGLTAVQYLYVDSNEGTSSVGLNNNDVQIIGEQIPVTWKITKDVTLKVAPGFTFYTSGGNTNYDGGVPTNTNVGAGNPSGLGTVTGTLGGTSTLGTAAVYGGTANSAVDPVFYSPREADDLAVISLPGEFNFKIAGVPIRPYWDIEYNAKGSERIHNVYLDPTAGVSSAIASQNKGLGGFGDDLAWAAGLQVGQNKKKGDWSGLLEFRQIGLGAVDQNINGTDYADSYANQQGFKAAAAYNFTDFLTGTVTFYDTWDLRDNLYRNIGGGNSAPAIGTTQYLVSESSLERVQVDLGWKF
jgi:hypothetical protein